LSDPDVGPGVPDFAGLDFARLWTGRAKTTRVETEILLRAMSRVDPARVLEVGSGGGRLTPLLRARAAEFVATDVTRSFVARLDPRWVRPPEAFRAAANVYRLPFADASFTCVVMVRVFNFLADPASALEEISRVLRPGGHLIMAYEPKPSLGTLAGDLRVALAPHERPLRSQTFSGVDPAPVRPSSFPAWAPSRGLVAGTLARAGYSVEQEWGSGLEDYRPFKWLPTGVFAPVGTTFGGTADGVFPSRFVRASTSPAPAGPTRAMPQMIACPSCTVPLGAVVLSADWSRSCPGCGFVAEYRAGILDAVAPGAGPRARGHGPAMAK
jgi:SAM-dependent methyltransferase